MSLRSLIRISLCLLALFVQQSVATRISEIVQIETGPIYGLVSDNGVTAFKSIPYAASPLGTLRFRAPRPPKPWTEPLNCTAFTAACLPVGGEMIDPREGLTPVTEDCLFINVWSPPRQPGEILPVIVYLHGGGFLVGSGHHPHTSPAPEDFVERSRTVYVTMNYRLGPLGFLAIPELKEEAAGVMGLRDQQFALQWVHRNIHKFGGNASQITLTGNSAGAFSICFHLTAPSSQSLFHRAVLQSAMCDFDFFPMDRALAQGAQVVDAAGCKGDPRGELECLQAFDAAQLMSVVPVRRGIVFYQGVNWFPAIDGKFIPGHPVDLVAAGAINRDIDVVLGATLDEGGLFVFISHPVKVYGALADYVMEQSVPAPFGDRIRAFYPSNIPPFVMLNRAFTDMFSCSVFRFAHLLAAAGVRRVFMYEDAQTPMTVKWPFNTLGAFHGSELRYLYNVKAWLAPEEHEMALAMMRHWGAFAHTGDPSFTVDGPFAVPEGAEIGAVVHAPNITEIKVSQCVHRSTPGYWPPFATRLDNGTVHISERYNILYRRSISEPRVGALRCGHALPSHSALQAPEDTDDEFPDEASQLAAERAPHSAKDDIAAPYSAELNPLHYHSHPFYVCTAHHQLATSHAPAGRVKPPGPFPEPLLSRVLNLYLPKTLAKLAKHGKLTVGVVGLLLLATLFQCARVVCARCRRNPVQVVKKNQ